MPNIVADQALLSRFAQWLLERTGDMHSANRLLRGIQVQSVMIGRQLRVAWENAMSGTVGLDELREDFSEAEIESIFKVFRTDPGSIVWSHSAASQRKRRDVLNEAAQALGFETWTKLETAVVNGRVRLRVA